MRKIDSSFVTVVMAAFNEEKGIGLTLQELEHVLGNPHFLVVDGKSLDKTIEIAENFGAEVHIQSGRGKGQAIYEALEQVKKDTKYVVLTDADFTYPARHIPEMMEILENNPSVGMVVGNRFNDNFDVKRCMFNTFYFGNRLLAALHMIANGINMKDPLSGLRVVRWNILRGWRPKSTNFDFEVELNLYTVKKGFRIVEVPIEYRHRIGEKKLRVRHGFIILKRIMAESYPSQISTSILKLFRERFRNGLAAYKTATRPSFSVKGGKGS
ncbi:MAG: glycosyltransferase family 2 protein [Candidatus Bathyarchaeia archaeon]